MFSERGTFIRPTSFNPPVLPPPDTAASVRRPGSPAWVMLDKVAYIGDRKNGTFAQAITRTGQAVGVSPCGSPTRRPSPTCASTSRT